MDTFRQFVEGYKSSTSLLPATKSLWGKNKVGIHDIANYSSWKGSKTTVQVAHVHDSEWAAKAGQKPKVRFIVGFGHGGYENKFHAHHDQTGAKLGHHTIVNTLHLEDGKIAHKDNDLHLLDKAPVHVYK